jgi:1-acyl-sn-glycerol-3-phosphate acyltransferase
MPYPLRALRASLRLLAMALASGLLFPLALLTRAAHALGARRAALVWGARVQCAWAAAIAPFFGLRVRTSGPPPRERFLIVANHVSYLDIVVLSRVFPGRFVAKSEIAGWPAIGWLARSVGTIFVVQRKKTDVLRVAEAMEETLAAGVSVLLFPEAGPSRGAGIEPFKSALFEIPAQRAIPCQAVALRYETPGVSHAPAYSVCWWGGMGFARHFWRLLCLGRIEAEVRWAGAADSAGERKELARAARASLAALFVPIRQEPPPPDLPWPELLPAANTARSRPSP